MPLFKIDSNNETKRYKSTSFSLERTLQTIVEKNLTDIFGVEFIASEYTLHGEHSGRIDTLGLDNENSPTIIEYKRDKNENVINQGLYYMDWLLNHRGDFTLLVKEKLGSDTEVNWNHPRLIIIAQSYSKWDSYAVNRMDESIELWEYVLYGEDILYLNQVYGKQRSVPIVKKDFLVKELVASEQTESNLESIEVVEYTIDYHQRNKQEKITLLFERIREGIFALQTQEGEIIETPNKIYIAYRHGKNFCEIEIQAKSLKLFLDIPIADLNDPLKLGRDVSQVGRRGTGSVEIKLESPDKIDYVLGLIEQSYRLTL